MRIDTVRTFLYSLLMSCLLLSFQASAETVRLKNGRVIENCTTLRVGDKLKITSGGSAILIPMSRIESIESGQVTEPPTKADEAEIYSKSLDAKIAEIMPTADEDAFLQIPWRTSLLQARRDANEQGKPIFMWIMNGDPLGGT